MSERSWSPLFDGPVSATEALLAVVALAGFGWLAWLMAGFLIGG